MPSMNIDDVDIEKVTYFVLHVIYNRRNEKNHLEIVAMRCCMFGKAEKNFAPTKSLPSDQKFLTMKILRAHLVSHSWVNCLVCNYQSLDPLSKGWIFVDGALQPLWYEGVLLPSEEQIKNCL